jgi:DNA repair exonuclease SbcCD ATPase subunit
MILFDKVRFKNFGSFGNYFTEVQFKNHQMTLVAGANGHGKSYALLDSITFGLFGKPFRKINIPRLVNTINGKHCVVEVYFTIGSHSYKVIRGLSPKVFEIYKDDELLFQNAKSKDYQKILEDQILKMNYKSFTQIVTLGSSSFVPFMQLSASDRREVIEDILDIGIFSSMNTNIKAKLSMTKDIILNKNRDIQLIKEKIDIQNDNIRNLKERKNKNISNNQNKIDVLENDIEKLNSEIKKLEEKIIELDNLKEEKDKLNLDMNKILSIKNKLEGKKKTILSDISFFENNENCPVCSQELDLGFKDKKQNDLQDKEREIESALFELQEQEKNYQENFSELSNRIESMLDVVSKINEKNNSISVSLKYIKDLRKDMLDISDFENNIQEVEKKIKIYEKQKEEDFNKLDKEKIKKESFSILQFLLKDSGIKAKIIKNYLPVMNELINNHLSEMSFFISFYLDEEFNEIIKSRHRDNFSYMNFSEGEKSRIDLAILLAWREIAKIKNSASCNILILDEIFDSSLDSMGIDDLMKLLRRLSADTNVFIITHKDEQLTDKFDKTISFVKKNNFSRIK